MKWTLYSSETLIERFAIKNLTFMNEKHLNATIGNFEFLQPTRQN